MRNLQHSINDWQDEVFPNRTLQGQLEKLEQEIAELYFAIEEKDEPSIQKEIADCMIVLMGIAGIEDIDLQSVVEAKMKINKLRMWEENHPGVHQHKHTLLLED